MCGLYGYTTSKKVKLTKAQQEIRANVIRGLAVSMQTRGHHSTGVAGITKDKTYIYKKAISAEEFIEEADYKKFMQNDYQTLIGHTRWATIGAKTDRNAHPFEIGNIIGAHNGHVTNYLDISKEIEVDSEAIFTALDIYDNDYEKAFKELQGKFAIVWVDKRDLNKIHFVVDGNPLTLVRVPSIGTYFWSSEEQPLREVLSCFFPIKNLSFFDPLSENVYTISNKHKIKKTPVMFKQYALVEKSAYKSYSEMLDEEDSEKQTEEDNEKVKALIVPKGNYSNLMNLTLEEMENMCSIFHQEGCAVCTQPIDFKKDLGFFYEMYAGAIYCMNCVEMNDDNDIIWITEKDYSLIVEELMDYYDRKAQEYKQ